MICDQNKFVMIIQVFGFEVDRGIVIIHDLYNIYYMHVQVNAQQGRLKLAAVTNLGLILMM